MTIVAALIVNPNLGIACSDERTTYTIAGRDRSYDFSRKLDSIGDYVLIGSSGATIMSDEVIRHVKSATKPDMSIQDIANLLRDKSIKRKEEIIETDVYKYFGITPEQLNHTNSGLDPNLLREARTRFDKAGENNFCKFIVAGYDPVAKIFKIYEAPTFLEPRDMSALKYDTVGSGSDLADASIADAIQRMKPDERDNIGLAKGCKMLMSAIRASWHNAGVGGRTQVIWTGKDTPKKELGYKESDALQNLLFLEGRSVVDDDFVDGVFRDIVDGGAQYADIRKRLLRAIPKDTLLDTLFIDGLHT